MKTELKRAVSKLWRDEAGSSTVEFVLWVPLFAFLLMLTVNASFVYMDLTRMENAARDGARRIAMGNDAESVVSAVMSQLPSGDYNIDTNCTTTEVACISVSRPSESILPFANFLGIGNLLGQTFGSEIRMHKEPGVATLHALPGTAA